MHTDPVGMWPAPSSRVLEVQAGLGLFLPEEPPYLYRTGNSIIVESGSAEPGWSELSQRWLPGPVNSRAVVAGPGDTGAVPYDPTVYLGSAAHYRYGRPAYSPELEVVLTQETSLDGNGRLLDAGCGPGVLTVRLAHLFEQAVGLDPDAEM